MKKNFGQCKIELGHGCQNGIQMGKWDKGETECQFFFGQITIDFKWLTLLFLEKAKMEIGQSSNF